MARQPIDQDLYSRAILPLGWQGKRVFTRQEWAQAIKFLKENADKNLADYLKENGMQ